MITCLPFLIGLILYAGLILINLFELVMRFARSSSEKECVDIEVDQMKTASNISNIVIGMVIISITYFLCKYRHENMAWAVVLAPLVMSLLLFGAILYKVQSLQVIDDSANKDNGSVVNGNDGSGSEWKW